MGPAGWFGRELPLQRCTAKRNQGQRPVFRIQLANSDLSQRRHFWSANVPRLVGMMLRLYGLPARPYRAQLEDYAESLAIVTIEADADRSTD